MTIGYSMHKSAVSALCLAMLLLGCSAENPDTLLASAKAYLAKKDSKAAVIQLKNALQVNPDLAEARFLLGKALLEGGDPRAAEVELRKAKGLGYSAEQLAPLLGRALLAQGQPQKAIDELVKVELATAEGKADLQSNLGQAYFALGKPELAQAAFNAALQAKADHVPAVIGQAQLKASAGDMAGGLSLLDGVLSKSPQLYDAWQLKGDILRAQNQVEAAIEAYRSGLAAKPDYLPGHVALISRLLDEGKLDDASKQLELMRKSAAKHPQTRLMEARLAYQRKQFPAAKEAIEQYLRMVPANAIGLHLAGAIEYELKSYARAEAHLAKAMSMVPGSQSVRQALAMSYMRSGQADKAVTTLQPVLEKIETDSNMLALAGEAFMRAGDLEKAGIYFAKASALDPGSAKKRTALAMTHMAKGASDVAFRELEKAAGADAGISADLALIAAHLQRREFDPALLAIAKLEKKQPKGPLVHNLRGAALLGKRNLPAARKSFEQALVLDPDNFTAASSLSGLDLEDRKPAEAKKRFEAMAARNPKNYQVPLALAELAAKSGARSAEVVALITKAITAAPTEVRPRLALIAHYLASRNAKSALAAAQDALAAMPGRTEILDAAGRAQHAAGDTNQALATYNRLVQLLPNSPHPHLRIAQIQLAAKNRDAAKQSLQKALELKPDLIEAQQGLIMLDMDASRFNEAIAGARAVQRQRPKEAVGYLLEGNVHAMRKTWADAERVYRQGLQQTGSSQLAIRLHAVLVKLGSNGADEFAGKWLKEHPRDAAFQLYFADVANSRKDYRVAAGHYRALLDAHPADPVLLNNLAWTSAQLNDPKAIGYAEQALKLAPDQPAMMDTLGVLLVDKGDTNRGLALLRKAVGLAPQATQLRLNLAKALIKSGQKAEARKELEVLAKFGDKLPAQAEVTQMLKTL